MNLNSESFIHKVWKIQKSILDLRMLLANLGVVGLAHTNFDSVEYIEKYKV